MNIYNNDGKSSHRRASTCSYCGNPEHNATNCPRVAEDYAYFTKSDPVIPIGISTTTKTRQWYAQPRYWGEWYQKCLDAHAKQVAAKKKASSSRTGSARSRPKCGFCGSKAHNRRNCDAMDRYTADAIEANRNWRRAFYKKFVEEMGISEGALLNLKAKRGYNKDDEDVIGVVTNVNWDELSLFCAAHDTGRYCYRDDQYVQNLKVTVQIGNETSVQLVSFGDQGIEYHMPRTNTKKNLVKYSASRYSWGNPSFASVLSPSETPLGDEWIEEGHAKAMAFLTKKRSEAKLDEAKVTDLINKWR
jgi:hypothetical protein